jgi:hypothetical protein
MLNGRDQAGGLRRRRGARKRRAGPGGDGRCRAGSGSVGAKMLVRPDGSTLGSPTPGRSKQRSRPKRRTHFAGTASRHSPGTGRVAAHAGGGGSALVPGDAGGARAPGAAADHRRRTHRQGAGSDRQPLRFSVEVVDDRLEYATKSAFQRRTASRRADLTKC